MLPASRPADDVVANGKERRAYEGEESAEEAEVLRPRTLAREGGTAGDDERGPHEEERTERLPEHGERNRDRDQGRRPDQNRGARRAGVADGEDEEDLRGTGHERSGDRERPQVP